MFNNYNYLHCSFKLLNMLRADIIEFRHVLLFVLLIHIVCFIHALPFNFCFSRFTGWQLTEGQSCSMTWCSMYLTWMSRMPWVKQPYMWPARTDTRRYDNSCSKPSVDAFQNSWVMEYTRMTILKTISAKGLWIHPSFHPLFGNLIFGKLLYMLRSVKCKNAALHQSLSCFRH